MSGFNSNYFNRHLINDMRNALNSVFIGEGETSARNLEQFRERQASQRADRIATGQANNAAAKAAKAERAAARAAAPAPAAGTPAAGAAPAAPAAQYPDAGKIRSNGPADKDPKGRSLSINVDRSFNISSQAQAQANANRNPSTTETPPRERYVNPNSPEGRVEASIAAGKEPDLQRDPNTGRLDPTRSARNLDRDATAAGNAAFDTSVKTNLGIDNASGMNRSDLVRKARDVSREKTNEIKYDVETESEHTLNKRMEKEADPLREKIYQDRSDKAAAAANYTNSLSNKYATMQTGKQPGYVEPGFTDSLKGEEQKNKAQMDLKAKEAKEATANTNRDFVAAAEYDAFRPSVTANDDTTLPAATVPAAAQKLSPAAEQEKQKAYDNWNSGKSGNPKGTPLTNQQLGIADNNDAVSAKVGFDVASSQDRTSQVLRQSQRAEELANKSRNTATRLNSEKSSGLFS
jgi:hypothetical protein